MVVKGKPLKLREVDALIVINTDKKATIANLSVDLGGVVFAATGSSWRNSGDKYDEYKGSLIALSRAVDELRTVLKAEVDSLED